MENSSSNQELFQYYDERAPEYEDFYRGKFPAKVPDPAIYQNDTTNIQKLLPGYVSGKCIDMACGTGFWLPVYAKNCTSITLVDQSEKMLDECKKKIQKLEIEKKTEIIRNDIFTCPLPEHEYDSVIIGFLISHFKETELDEFFRVIRKIIKPDGKFIIIDSVWNEIIAKIRSIKSKSSMITRTLYDGRKFLIYKRYSEKQDIQDLAEKHNINLTIVYWGKVFFLATGEFSREAKA